MTDNTKDIQQLGNTLNKVRTRTLEVVKHDENHLRWGLGIKIVLLAFVVAYMSWIYSNLRTVDAEFLVVVGQQKFLEELPTLKSQVELRLSHMAPSLMNRTGETVMEAIPTLRKNLEATIKETLLEKGGPLEKHLSGWLSSFTHETQKVTDEMFPGFSSYDKITKLRKYILEDFKDGIEEMSFEIGDSIGKHSFIGELRRLAEGKNLTEKEKLQRDIVAISYLLIDQHTSGMKLGEFSFSTIELND